MRRIIPIVLALGVLGCRADPETGRLKTGSEAIVYSKDDKAAFYTKDFYYFGIGTKVVVLDDDQSDFEGLDRFVRVTIKDGSATGKTADIRRKDLRPVAR
jgi:hypothetical protein